MKRIGEEVARKVIDLRVSDRCSLTEIVAETGLSNGTVYSLIKSLPLDQDEITGRRVANAILSAQKAQNKREMVVSQYMQVAGNYTTDEIGRISLFAVCFALAKERVRFSFPGENFIYDLLVEHENGNILRVQVKTAQVEGRYNTDNSVSCRLTNNKRIRGYYAGKTDVFACFNPKSGNVYFFDWDDLRKRNQDTNKIVALIDDWRDNYGVFRS